MAAFPKNSILALALLCIQWGILQAQPFGISPRQRLQNQTALMKELLSLNADQVIKVKAINEKTVERIETALSKQQTDDRIKVKKKMETIFNQQDKELKTVLTEDQWRQWKKRRDKGRPRPGRSY